MHDSVRSFFSFSIVIDVLLIISMILIFVDVQQEHTLLNEYSDLIFGLGYILGCTGLLRHLGLFHPFGPYFESLMKNQFVILHFMTCVMCVFWGFAFSGWLVIGRYHTKVSGYSLLLIMIKLVNFFLHCSSFRLCGLLHLV